MERRISNRNGARVTGCVLPAVLMALCFWCPQRAAAQSTEDSGGEKEVRVARADHPGQLRFMQRKKDDSAPGGARGANRGRRGANKNRSRPKTPSTTRTPVVPRGRGAARLGGRGSGESVTSRINLDFEDYGKPYNERKYLFGCVECTYAELVENFGRMSGMQVLGEAPQGTVTFVTAESMTFDAALGRVRLLLFKFKPREPYTLMHHKDRLEVIRVVDGTRILPLKKIFRNLEEFEAANLDDYDLAMLMYTPDDTSVADFDTLRDFMPDYVRIAPMPETNSLSVFALVVDIKKYLSLVKLFEGAGDDPRVLDKLRVHHLAPSQAVETLRLLMDDLGETTAIRPRGGRKGADGGELPGQRTILFPDDAQKVIVIRAVTRQIERIKEMLLFIDVDFGDESDPVLIPIEHAEVNEILNMIRPLVTGEQSRGTKATTSKISKKSVRTRRMTSVSSDDLTMLAEPRTNTLVVVGVQEQVDRVKYLVTLFDVPAKDSKPEFVHVEHASLDRIIALVTDVIGGARGKDAGSGRFKVIAEPVSNSIILLGGRRDVERAKELIHELDVEEPEATLHTYKLYNASPGTVLDVIMLIDAEASPAGKSKRGGKGKVRVRTTANIYTDEATKTLFVVCTDQEWEQKYRPLIERIDAQASEAESHVVIPVIHRAPDEVIATITQLLGLGPKRQGPTFAVSVDAIIVSGASPVELDQIRALVTDIDQEGAERDRRLFEIHHVAPTEIQAVIQSGVVTGRKGVGRGKKGVTAAGRAIQATVIGRTLVVSALPDELDEIAELIAQLDVEGADTNVLRVYPVPAGHDVQAVITALNSLVIGGPRGKKGLRKGGVANLMDDIRVVPQIASRKILVSAPLERFEEIEEAIEILIAGEPLERIVIKFVPVHYADPAAIVAVVEPILQVRMQELTSMGEILVGSDGQKRAGGRKSSSIHMTPDVQGERIIITAPAMIVAEAETLIAELDREGTSQERIMRTILLARTSPEEMVAAISAMLSGERRAPTKRPRVKKILPNLNTGPTVGGTEDVTIVVAPGGGAVILTGAAEDIDEVEQWIRHLDDTAVGEKIIKVYDIVHADISQLADAIMAYCDTPKKSVRKPKGDDLLFDFEPVGPRIGSEIVLTTDYWNKKIVVRATPQKIHEVDTVVELYEGKDGEPAPIGGGEHIPYLIFELEYADPFDAMIELEGILDVLWPFGGEAPDVDYLPGTSLLVVACLPEHEKFVKDVILKYVDKESDKPKGEHTEFVSIEGASASEVAAMLKLRMPEVLIDIERLGEDLAAIEVMKPYRPCVLPLSLLGAIESAASAALTQTADEETASESDQEKEELAQRMAESFAAASEADQEDASASETEEPEEERVRVMYDNRQGVIVIRGAPRLVDDVKDALEDILEEVKSMGTKPDIRVFRIRYRDVNVAGNILESMFNAQRSTQQRGAQQRQLQQLRQQLRQQAQQRRGGQPGTPQGRDGAGGRQDPAAEQEAAPTGPKTGEIRVHPDPQTRSLIVRAATEDFPIIIELLATIDRPADVKNDFRIFKLERLVAADVEEQLKVLLGVGQPRRTTQQRRSSQQRQRGRNVAGQGRALQQLEEAILNMEFGGGDMGAIDAATDIKITSNPSANTLLVMAPEPALDLIENFINRLEEQDIPTQVTVTYTIKHADATTLAASLGEIFGGSRGGGRRASSGGRGPAASAGGNWDPTAIGQVSVTADDRTNTLIVTAFEPDLPRIEELIHTLDQDADAGAKTSVFVLISADAVKTAKTLNDVYGSASRGRGARGRGTGGGIAQAVQFVGDAESNSLFVTAPERLQEEIAERIKGIDEQAAGRVKPRTIKLTAGTATDIAQKLSEAFGGGRGGRGGGSNLIKITGDDNSKQLFVTAPEAVFTQIEAMARSMDQPANDIQLRIFNLKHARAADVQRNLMDAMRQLGQQLSRGERSDMGVFTAVADDRSNAIICLGSPKAFIIVDQVLAELDVESTSVRTEHVVKLEHADATELARSLDTVFRQSGGGGRGQQGLTVVADVATNSLIVLANEKEFGRIGSLVTTLDVRNTADARIHVVEIEHADGDALNRSLQEVFGQGRGRGGRGGGRAPNIQISNPQGTNTILVRAKEEDFQEVLAVIQQLDTASGQGDEIEMIALLHSDAEQMKEVLETFLSNPGQGGGRRGRGGAQLRGDVRISANTQNNTVIISGNRAEIDNLAAVVAKLDVEVEGAGNAPRIIPLVYARASQIEPVLTQMFVDSRRGGGRRGSGASTMTPVITSDEATNSLIVRANAGDFGMIQGLIRDLDTESTADQTTFTIVSVAEGVKVADLAELIQTTINEGERIRAERYPGMQPGTVVINADPRSNSLVVAGSAALFADVRRLVETMQNMGITGGTKTRILRLEHLPPDEAKRLLDQIIDENNRSNVTRGRSSSRRSGSARPPARRGTSRRPR